MKRKLTNNQADLLRVRHVLGYGSIGDWSTKLGVSVSTVASILQGKIYQTPLALLLAIVLPTRHDPPTLLTARDVIEIRELSTAMAQTKIARRFGVNPLVVHRIAKGRSYAWITTGLVTMLEKLESELCKR